MSIRTRFAAAFAALLLLGASIGTAAGQDEPAGDPGTLEPPAPDAQITRAVAAELSAQTGVRGDNLQVESAEGVVSLTGTVESLADKRQAVRLATTIRGVRSVVDRLEVRPTERSDQEIAAEIAAALRENPATGAWKITGQVLGGQVALRGTVHSHVERMLCEAVASEVRGVRGIENRIHVDAVAARPDEEIQAEIEQWIGRDIWVVDPAVQVAVDGGSVTLSGTVGTVAERQRLYDAAWVPGVDAVDHAAVQVSGGTDSELRRHRPYLPGNDHEILQALQAALARDPRVDAAQIQVHVEQGLAKLAGTVPTLQAKRAAAEDARNTLGVWEVENALRVHSDDQIAADDRVPAIRAALERDAYLSGQEVAVEVEDGTAILRGTVRSSYDQRRAGDLASRVRGVSEVKNLLSVAAESGSSDDLTLKYRIENQLYWSPLIDSNRVRVAVERGHVTLTGNVDRKSASEAAVEIVRQAGAREVVNELDVRRPR